MVSENEISFFDGDYYNSSINGIYLVVSIFFQLSYGAIFRTLKNWQVYFWDKVIPNICHRQMGSLVKVSLLE